MGLAGAQQLYLQSATRLTEILAEIVAMQPRAVVIDSIQTVYLDDVSGSAGSVSQARAHAGLGFRGYTLGFRRMTAHSTVLRRRTCATLP